MDLYIAYGRAVEFKNYQGLEMPKWEDLPERIQRAWLEVRHRAYDLFY